MSERRACTLVAADRRMIRYPSRRPPDAELRTRLRDLANQRRRFRYRRLFILLRAQGEPSGVNRIYRLYREEGLTVRKRKAHRRAVGTRTPILVEARVNARWSLDFVHDQFARGRRFRILNIVDDVTRECLAAIPLDLGQTGRSRADCSHRCTRQAADDRVRQWYGVHLECDLGVDEGASGGMALHRAWQADAEWLHRIVQRPGLRDELLNESLFVDLDQARQLIGAWGADYNTARPHSSLG
jgi:transposase InsO family protein